MTHSDFSLSQSPPSTLPQPPLECVGTPAGGQTSSTPRYWINSPKAVLVSRSQDPWPQIHRKLNGCNLADLQRDPLTCTLFLLLSPNVLMGGSYLDLWDLVYWATIGPLYSLIPGTGTFVLQFIQTLTHYFLSIYVLLLMHRTLASC